MAAPTLTMANDGTGTSATATLAGDAGATHRLFYRKLPAAAWTTGLTRVGNGTIVQTGLTAGRYEFIAVSDSAGVYTLPSSAAMLSVFATDSVATSPLENLRALVAASTTFQAWVGAASAALALPSVYRVALTGAAIVRPLALVREKEPADHVKRAIAGGASTTFVESGTLELLFENDVADATLDHGVIEAAFMDTVRAIIADMDALAGSGAYLIVRGFQIAEGPARAHPDTRHSAGDYYQVLYDVQWGIEG